MGSKPVIYVDESGFLNWNGIQVSDSNLISELWAHTRLLENGAFQVSWNGQEAWLASWDWPRVVHHAQWDESGVWHIQGPWGQSQASWDDIYWDFADRIVGVDHRGFAFVLKPMAAQRIYEACEEIFEDQLIYRGRQWPIKRLESVHQMPVAEAEFWRRAYRESETGWDLGTWHPALPWVLDRMRWPVSRVWILGCGRGHDAAFWAQQGHRVQAWDIAPEALEAAGHSYSSLNINWVRSSAWDAFQTLPAACFDIVFEHTFYCAIEPSRRSDLVRLWWEKLTPGGFFVGIFFCRWRWQAPPFGGCEWEYHHRLTQQGFRVILWQRLWEGLSPAGRLGTELLVVAQKPH